MGGLLRKFYEAVLPPELPDHYYCLVLFENKPKAKPKFQRYYETIDSISEATTSIIEKYPDHNLYYGLAQLSEKGRKTDKTINYRCISIDLDCYQSKDGREREYKNHTEASEALYNFMIKTEFPKPNLILNSGWGYHVYWIFDSNVSSRVWNTELKTKLSVICKTLNLHIDYNALKATQIFRPLGSNSVRFEPFEVRKVVPVHTSGPFHNPATFYTQLDEICSRFGATSEPKQDYLPARTTTNTEISGAFELDKIRSECEQINFVCNQRGNVSEPFWYAALSIIGSCIDGERLIHTYSSGHSSYSKEETDFKFNQWRNAVGSKPSTCIGLERVGQPNVCTQCKWYNTERFKSPIALGSTYQSAEDILSKNSQIDRQVVSSFPDDKFKIRNGKIIKLVQNDDGFESEWEVFPSLFYLQSVYINTIIREEVCKIQWFRYGEARPPMHFDLPTKLLAPGRERDFSTECGKYGMLMPSVNHTLLSTDYLRSFKDRLDRYEEPIPAYSNMGWVSNHEFVLGPFIIHGKQRKPIEVAEASRKVMGICTPHGSYDSWRSAINKLNSKELLIHQFAFLNGFAAPLMPFTGINAAQVNLYGETGSGKSTVHSAVMSMFGQPEELRLKPIDTLYSTYNRMGIYNSIPIWIDEITTLSPQVLQGFVYSITQGENRRRLNTEQHERDTKTWRTLILSSGNKSVVDKLNTDPTTSQALLMRVLELGIDSTDVFSRSSEVGRNIITTINENYGHASVLYLMQLTQVGKTNLKKGIKSFTNKLCKQFKFDGEERFWETIFITTWIGAKIAYDLGIHTIDFEQVIGDIYSKVVKKTREVYEENRISAVDILSTIINKCIPHAVIDPELGAIATKIAAESKSVPHQQIVMRIEEKSVFIDRSVLYDHLREASVDRQWFLNSLFAEDILKSSRAKRIVLTKGTIHAGIGAMCYEFNSESYILRGIINDNVLYSIRGGKK